MTKRLLAITVPVALVGALVLGQVPARAADCPVSPYPPRAAALLFGANQVSQGGLLVVSGGGFRADVSVSIFLRSASDVSPRSLGVAGTGSTGAFRQTVIIPTDADEGANRIIVKGLDAFCATKYLSGDIDVLAGALRVSNTVVERGALLTVSGGGLKGSTPVAFYIRPVDGTSPRFLGSTTTQSDGDFSARVRIPANATLGNNRIYARGTRPDGSTVYKTAFVRVIAPSIAAWVRTTAEGSVALAGLMLVGVVAGLRRRRTRLGSR